MLHIFIRRLKGATLGIIIFLTQLTGTYAAPITINSGDTLSIEFKFEQPFSSTPNLLYVGFNTDYTGLTEARLYDGSSLLGTYSVNAIGSVGAFFRSSSDVSLPSPAFGPVVNFSSIIDQSINGRVDFSFSSGPLQFDQTAPVFAPIGGPAGFAETCPLGAGPCSYAGFATITSVSVLQAPPPLQFTTPLLMPSSQGPSIASYPEPGSYFNNLLSFLGTHSSEFLPEDQVVISSAVTKVEPLINPEADTFLKFQATHYAQLFRDTAYWLSLESAVLSGVAGFVKWAGLQLYEKLFVEGNPDPGVHDTFNIVKLADTTYECAPPLITPEAQVGCALSVSAYLMGSVIALPLEQYGEDPINPDYMHVFVPRIPAAPDLGLVFQPFVDSAIQASLYLEAVNKSFDRYSAAYADGNAMGAGLQTQAILSYLGLYQDAAASASESLISIAMFLDNSGFNQPYDPLIIVQLQDELRVNGIPSDVVDLLAGLGLDSLQIEQVKDDVLNLDPFSIPPISPSDSLALAAGTFANASGAYVTTIPDNVPEPGTLALFLLPLTVLFVFRQRFQKEQ